jgi:hypothetical protein
MRILYVSDEMPNLVGWEDVTDDPVDVLPTDAVPSRGDLEGVDIVCVLGPLVNLGRAHQLAGVLNRVIRQGLTVVIGYPGSIHVGLAAFVTAMTGLTPEEAAGGHEIVQPHPAFADYFGVFGRSMAILHDLGAETETLGSIVPAYEVLPAAVCTRRGEGLVYVVPYYVAGGAAFLLRELFDAVLTHREGLAD